MTFSAFNEAWNWQISPGYAWSLLHTEIKLVIYNKYKTDYLIQDEEGVLPEQRVNLLIRILGRKIQIIKFTCLKLQVVDFTLCMYSKYGASQDGILILNQAEY